MYNITLPPVLQIVYWVLVIVMAVGMVGAFVPAIPGISLIAISAFIWMAVNNFQTGVVAFSVAIVVFGLSTLVDFLAGYVGAKQAGASKWGQWGAMIGGIVGILGLLPTVPFGGPLSPVLGIILGSALGAIVGELLYRKDALVAVKAALGILVGSIVGNLIQGLLAIVTTIIFIWTTWGDMSRLGG